MAGLFYIVRLFVYHTEAGQKPEPERSILQRQFAVMEKKLWNIITTPAMILTLLSGIWMVWINSELLHAGWLHVKLTFVAGLLIYHFMCQRIIGQLEKGTSAWTSMKLRLWNELATIFLVAIVFTVVLKSTMDWFYGLAGLLAFAAIIMSSVKIYKYFRK
jgi:putative membrane protein